MGIIRELPQNLIDKIAAGEVVERPSSIVKELIENAIDAQASSICIRTAKGGKEELVVIDDGCGMSAEDALLSIRRHATSKLAAEEDLFRISTMGFRGEALSAIAAVSKFRLETKEHDRSVIAGTCLEAHGGNVIKCTPTGTPGGTKITVAELFYNTPARQKFLKSDAVEQGHIAEAVTDFCFAFPRIRFELHRDGKEQFICPAVDLHRERVLSLVDRKFRDALVAVDEPSDAIRLTGFVSEPGSDRADSREMRIFVNGRPLRDRLLIHAATAGYGELMPRGRYPLLALFVDLDPSLVDVNVHPTKREVRFSNGGAVHDFIKHAVRKAVQQQAMQRVDLHETVSELLEEGSPRALGYPLRRVGGGDLGQPRERFAASGEERGGSAAYESAKGSVRQAPPDARSSETVSLMMTHVPEMPFRIIGQLSATYILCEGADHSLVLIDQHAAHEKIGFDQLKQQAVAGSIVQQRLLFPVQCTLSASQAALLEEQLPVLEKAGFEIEPFGGGSFVVKAVPMLLHEVDVAELLTKIAGELAAFEQTTSIDDKLHALFAVTACHAQIRGGDRLTLPEMEALLRQMHHYNVTHCPHGRPVMVTVERSEIERRFKRT